MEPVEFSKFYILLNALREGDSTKREQFDNMLQEFKDAKNCNGPLDELGQIFLYKGIEELCEYVGTDDIYTIGKIDKLAWEKLQEDNESELPPHLANTMIMHAKNNNLSKEISKKWNSPKRQIDKNIMGMARYITEGIIDAID